MSALDVFVSVFKPGKLGAPVGDIRLREVVNAVRSEKHRSAVEQVRNALDEHTRKELKKTVLHAITLSATFPKGKSIANAPHNTYTGLIQIDLDHVSDPASTRDILASDPHVLFAHRSPSGDGVKAAVCVAADARTHAAAFHAAIGYIKNRYGFTPDAGIGNLNRLFYVSADPDLRANEDAIPLPGPYESPTDNSRKPLDSKQAHRDSAYPVEEIRRALDALPDRPAYEPWLKWANAVRDAVGRDRAVELLRERWPEEAEGEYDAKMGELLEVTAGTLFFEARARGWLPEIYYENHSDRFYARNAHGEFRSYTGSHAKEVLANYRTPKDEITNALFRIRHEQCIDAVLNVSGAKRGLHDMNGLRVLVPVGPRLVEPKPGQWPTVATIWNRMLGAEQCRWFLHWLSSSLRSFYAGNWQPSQVVAFIGPTASAKSLTQSILTALFGGRSVDVMQAITGGTEFNGDWAEATHLMVEDKFTENTKSVRDRVKENVKAVAVNLQHRIHPKGKQALQLRPFWRMTISCNPTIGSLAVLPPLDDSVRNKISLLWTQRFDMPMPARTAEEKRLLWEIIEKELPALIHELLGRTSVPDDLQDDEGRFEVRAYHHPEALTQHHRLTPEGEILEAALEAIESMDEVRFEGTAQDLLTLMISADRAGRQTARSLGKHLTALAESRPDRVRITKRSNSWGNEYEITTDVLDLL